MNIFDQNQNSSSSDISDNLELNKVPIKRPNYFLRKFNFVFIILLISAIIYLIYIFNNQKHELTEIANKNKLVNKELGKIKEENEILLDKLEYKEIEISKTNKKWKDIVDELNKAHEKDILESYKQFNEIIHEGNKTISYINNIEKKLKNGNLLKRNDIIKLKSIANGVNFLHKQYKKPLSKFKELNRYFNKQIFKYSFIKEDPINNTPLLNRVFNRKRFTESRLKYFEEKGKVEAFKESKLIVNQVYKKAQKEMRKISFEMDQYIYSINNIVNNKKNLSDLFKLLDKSKEVIKVHKKIIPESKKKLINTKIPTNP